MDWIEILKTGTHTSMSGQAVTIDDAYLQRIASSYNPAYHEAPLVLGHPQDNAPAYGWVEAVKAEGGKLLAKVKQVAPELRDWVREGRFKHRSASLYSDLDGKGPYLRHIGFLGAQPPAVKGLAPVSFGDGAAVSFEFEERSDVMDWEKLQRMLQEFSEKITTGVQKALGRSTAGEPAAGGDVQKQIADAVKAATDQLTASFSEQVKALKMQIGEQQKQLTAAEETARRAGIRNFAERLKTAGRWIPAFDQMHLVEFMEALPSGEGAVVEFSETKTEGGKTTTITVKQSPLEFFQSFLEKLPKIVELGEVTGELAAGRSSKIVPFTPGDRQAKNIDLAERAQAIADERKIDYGQALEIARRERAGAA